MIIRQVDDKYEIIDNYTGISYGTYNTYDEAADKIKELRDDMRSE